MVVQESIYQTALLMRLCLLIEMVSKNYMLEDEILIKN